MKKLILRKATTSKSFNKIKKQVFLGLDDNKRKVYIWDFVKVSNRESIRTPWISQIYWTPLDGAFIDSHPSRIAMNCGDYTTVSLAQFFRDKYDISDFLYPSLDKFTPSKTIEKVTYAEYVEWVKSIGDTYESVKQASIESRDERRRKIKEEEEKNEEFL